MAACLRPALASAPTANPAVTCPRFLYSRFSTKHVLPVPALFHRPFPSIPCAWSGLCLAASPGPQPPPESEPAGKDSSSSSGLPATLSRLQDTMQIFFAVLFWMSLFFWASAWDRSNNGPPNEGSRFRK